MGAPALAVSTRARPQLDPDEEEKLAKIDIGVGLHEPSEGGHAYFPVLIRIHSRFISRSIFGSWALMT
jgi:hypothetical protein